MSSVRVRQLVPGVVRRTKRVLLGVGTSRQSSARVRNDPTTPNRRDWREILLRYFTPEGMGVEVGSWKGNFAARLLTETKPRTLHLVDPWRFRAEEDYIGANYGGRATGGQAQVESIYQDVLARFSEEIRERRCCHPPHDLRRGRGRVRG